MHKSLEPVLYTLLPKNISLHLLYLPTRPMYVRNLPLQRFVIPVYIKER